MYPLSSLRTALLIVVTVVFSSIVSAQDRSRRTAALERSATINPLNTSPFAPPKVNDYTFVIDTGAGLDTGCTFRSSGPLRIRLPIGRVLGDLAKLRANGLVPANVRVEFPAFDVDSAGAQNVPPERDRISVNGKIVPGEFMTGLDNAWVMQRFDIPIEWLNLPTEPATNGTVSPADNEITIDIDTASGATENWCTAVDWVTITIDRPIPPRPWIGAHGIFSDGSIWNTVWVPSIRSLGIPADPGPSMGRLDSIQNNAAKIASSVTAARQRWGVDRVNIVAHSKGGLDSREYIENNQSIEKLVQLGTPNAGSPLADAIQSGSIRLLGLGNIAANLLAGGIGGYQLTTPYMGVYNSFHGFNPKVTYMSIGGLQTPGGWFSDPGGNILQGIVGPGDLIVPLSSVHALPFTINRTVFSTFPPTFGLAAHTQLHRNPTAFAIASPLVRAPGFESASLADGTLLASVSPDKLTSEESPEISIPVLQHTQTFGGKLQQPQTATHIIAVDSAATLAFTLLHSEGDFDLKLTDPNGQVFDANTIVGRPDVSRQQVEIPGGFIDSYSFTGSIAVGNWTSTITAQNTTGPVDYNLIAWLENPLLQMTATVDRLSAPIGGSFIVNATLKNGTSPVTGATANATVLLPDGTTSQNVSLADDGQSPDAVPGDGVYCGRFTGTTQAGAYGLAIDASGTISGGPFSRETYLSIFASASHSTILPGVTDFGRDLNANGLFDVLVLQVPVQVTTSGSYRVAATLADSAGNVIESSNSFVLTSGSTSVELTFDGLTLFAHGVNGPFHVTSLRMGEERNQIILPLTEITSVQNTAAYLYTQFEGAGLSLTGTESAKGIDTNGNSKFDVLQADIGVNVRQAGSYQWTARLRDPLGREITLANNSGNLPAGLNSIRLTFDGSAIGRNGVNGPFSITDLLLFSTADTLSAANVFSSPPLAASDFEGFVAAAVTVQLSSTNYMAFENQHRTQVTVTRSGIASGAVALEYHTVDGTASARSDYTAAFGTLNFAAGETTKTFDVLITDDAYVEGNETFSIALSNPAGGAALGETNSAVVTIVSDDTNAGVTNPAEDSAFFVRQHYSDFLEREPDASGFTFWVNNIESCGTDQRCREVKRIDTAGAFLLSIEFQQTGSFVLRAQRAALGHKSDTASARVTYQQFLKDARQVSDGVIVGQPGAEQKLEANRQAYALQIVASAEFIARYPMSQTEQQFIDALFASAAVTPTVAERQAALTALDAGGTAGRAAALINVTDSASLMTAEFNPSFVLMQYYGYLRRNPTDLPDGNDNGYQFWLMKLNQFNGNFRSAEMVKAFITSGEYRARFGP